MDIPYLTNHLFLTYNKSKEYKDNTVAVNKSYNNFKAKYKIWDAMVAGISSN